MSKAKQNLTKRIKQSKSEPESQRLVARLSEKKRKKAELLTFARVLAATHNEWSVGELFHFLEKPWKWTLDRDAWIAAGRGETLAVDA
jgi:hypothetical protein